MTKNTPVDEADADLLSLFDPLEDNRPGPAGDSGSPPPPMAPPGAGDPRRRKRRKLLAGLLAVVLLLVGSTVVWYLANRKPLSQLPGVNVMALPTYKGSIYGVASPLGVAVSPDGSRIYVAQSGSKPAVVSFDANGTKLGELTFPPEAGSLHSFVYMTIAGNGDLYVGDRASGSIYVFDSSGTYRSTFTPKDSTLHFSPLGIAVAADGSLFVANVLSNKAADHCILVFDKDGNLTATYGKGQLNYPNQLSLDAAGDLYVTDSNDGRLVVFEPGGNQTTLVAHGVGEGDLGLPRGLAIDDQGRIYVVDTTDHMVRTYRRIDPVTAAPPFVGSFGEQGIEDGRFMYPNGLAVDARARIYVADRENNRIQIWGF